MANMSYCRFRNTVIDLQDCYDALSDPDEDNEPLDPDELRAKKQLISLCEEIVMDFREEE